MLRGTKHWVGSPATSGGSDTFSISSTRQWGVAGSREFLTPELAFSFLGAD